MYVNKATVLLTILTLALLALTARSEEPNSDDKILVGASYFAGWWKPTPNKWHARDGSDWRPQFPGRVPLLGQYNNQPTMDREIVAASDAGVDFFSMLWYPVDPENEPEPGARFLNVGLTCFLKSPEAHRMRFYVEYVNHRPFSAETDDQWNACMDVWLEAMRHPSYLRVGDRAVLKIHSGGGFIQQCDGQVENAQQRIESLREAARRRGVGELLVGCGVMAQSSIPAEHWAAKLFDFTACYMDVPPLEQTSDDYPFQTLTRWTEAARDKHRSDVVPHVLHLPAGWNPRPWPDRRARFTAATPQEWADSLREMRRELNAAGPFGFPLPDGRIQKAFTIYAWNEFGEGGYLAPTRGEGAMKLDAIRQVFGR